MWYRNYYLSEGQFEEISGVKYNGVRVFYFLFIPVWKSGFYHSTSWQG